MKLQFLGAAREVTGSKHLITTEAGKKILLDCGIYQGKGLETDSMNRNLGFEPAEIDHIILSHAHIDHSGLIPYMYRLGFRGSVVCTNATRDLCSIMLPDSGHIQENDTYYFNKKRARQGLPPVQPIYSLDDARKCLGLFIGVPYERKFKIDENIKVKFTNTGHMLGSGVVNLEIVDKGEVKRVAYTGDIGRPENRILRSPDAFPQCDYLITESTYGDRLHPARQDAEAELLRVVKETCAEKGGKLIIPSFAIGRTQELVHTLNNFFNDGLLPRIKIYVDSPLAVNATEIFRLHPDCFNDDVHTVMETDPDPFGFSSLHYIKTAEESKRLNTLKEPCVIISASGMMEAGRIKHHLANNISNPRNTILAVGYCGPRTLGARILRGDSEISIFGVLHAVKAKIERIEAFSGHADYKEMIDFLNCQAKDKVKRTFLVHGDFESANAYKGHLLDDGYKNVEVPELGQEFEM
ncbi:MAG: MBL fold metallo-hydrolase [Bacteroidetes bacterium HGW-Bacteroidetes-11]|jgi:metallo-beta-lactamase family protein|nr:MAG: MBL fold metallo-hydrolase [Bacteroidetes bacterium HGW-Bacteroidetes-11]